MYRSLGCNGTESNTKQMRRTAYEVDCSMMTLVGQEWKSLHVPSNICHYSRP